ncbi:inositol monophosphatase family protein [Salidesulfovibrio onnuriiensis]|uniref:inositol monophosphatase family protein n=1 Tax=Salidesulfovibrio onnuriiensis TaxID=2583823 RepID=UPI0011C70F86|nr:inositol monophosphatase family protein [Salidesulfovibrio onnuriiensis]
MKSLLESTVQAVSEVGSLIVEADGKPRNIRFKGKIDLVTDTDMAVELALKEKLERLVPGSSFLAEETAKDAELGDNTWIIDPVDGTTNFAHGLPMVATSVGLWRDGRMELGVINLPLMGEMFAAARGHGAFMNGKPISVSSVSSLERSLLATGFPYAVNEHLEKLLAQLRNVLEASQGVRRAGAAALDLAYVACGRYEGFYESALNPWDTAAGWLLVEEAGGRVSGFAETDEYVLGAPSILATNSRIHAELSRLVNL